MKVRSRPRSRRCETICIQVVELLCGRWDERRVELELELELGAARRGRRWGRSFPTVNARGLPYHTDTHLQLQTLADAMPKVTRDLHLPVGVALTSSTEGSILRGSICCIYTSHLERVLKRHTNASVISHFS